MILNRRSIAAATVFGMLTIAALVALVPIAFAHRHERAIEPPAATEGSAAFAWLRPGQLPSDWTTLRLPDSPARLSAPPGWRVAGGDAGTRTRVLRGPSGRIIGY
ncbi:MAG TPA: hypothetical protein VGI17_01945, partial [Solirubrobacterales bacterium]